MKHRTARPSTTSRMAASAVAALVACSSLVSPALASTSQKLKPFPSANVTFDGHGWGPAWGLAQWGGFGYAAVHQKTFQWLLNHYYPGTTLRPLTKKADRRIIRVSVEENAGAPVIVTSRSAFTITSKALTSPLTVATGHAVKSVLVTSGPAAGTWNLYEAAACTGSSCQSLCAIKAKSWSLLKAGLTDPTAVPSSSSSSAPHSKLLQLCRADGQVVTYRGSLEAYDYYGANTNYKHLSRTLSLLPLEQYVADVTPAESPSGWGSLPSGAKGIGPQDEPYGFQELEAQAIAARTYVLAEIASGGWYGYADICDDICQSYTQATEYESSITNRAVADTAGQALLTNGSTGCSKGLGLSGGCPAPTQYASSSGGYTQGSPAFKPVVDAGDSVCLKNSGGLGCNPWHDWTVSVAVSKVESTFPSVGALMNVQVTQCNGLGQWGGRVLEIEIVGSKGRTSVTGNAWMFDFSFDSNWFAVTDGPGTKSTSCGVSVPGTGSPGGQAPASRLGQPGQQMSVPPPGRLAGLSAATA